MRERDFAAERQNAVDRLKASGLVCTPEVARALGLVPREKFLPAEVQAYAYVDSPLPIGFGQTTSALHMTAIFCEHGELSAGKKVLEVGGGCGYMSCVYAELVAPTSQPKAGWGHVWSVEIVQALADAGRRNVELAGYGERVTLSHGDASTGLDAAAPYDAIIVASAAPGVPAELLSQLSPGGVLLIPIGQTTFSQELLKIRKRQGGDIETERLLGVAFVPLRGRRGWDL